jgi:hypothetical protein
MPWRQWILACAVAGIAVATTATGARPAGPRVFLWAWETATDLRGVNGTRAGVAFLAGSVLLRADDAISRPRLQPLRIAERTRLVVVVRIDVDPRVRPSFSVKQQHEASDLLIGFARRHPDAAAVQVDFDAPTSGRVFYAGLLARLRRVLPTSTALSMTALASWCQGDPWIATLPVDEAVPMLFRMGPDARFIRGGLQQGDDFAVPLCRRSLGLSTDEPFSWHPSARRVYLFNPRGWNDASALDALTEYGQ